MANEPWRCCPIFQQDISSLWRRPPTRSFLETLTSRRTDVPAPGGQSNSSAGGDQMKQGTAAGARSLRRGVPRAMANRAKLRRGTSVRRPLSRHQARGSQLATATDKRARKRRHLLTDRTDDTLRLTDHPPNYVAHRGSRCRGAGSVARGRVEARLAGRLPAGPRTQRPHAGCL